jgi:putative restriction endonuclease
MLINKYMMSVLADTERWLKIAANLRVDRKGSIAPYKPILLLVIAELAEEGKLNDTYFPLTGELVFRFLNFCSITSERRTEKPDVHLPYFHLRNEGCWTPLDETGQPTLERSRAVAARIDETFLHCMNNDDFRNQLRRILITKYFVDAGERAALYNLVRLKIPPGSMVKEDSKLYDATRDRGREARFRLTVVPAYNYTCALTGYRCTTIDSGSIVDAAHIHQFSNSRNNHPRNGIALSKNAHWMFDAGLWSLTDDYRIIVAKDRFAEFGESCYLLKQMHGKEIALPSEKEYWPDKQNLAWHRNTKFNNK